MNTATEDSDTGSKTVGELIRRYRLKAGLTQEELGEKAEVSVRAIRNLEQNKVRRPRRSTLQRLAPGLGLTNTDTTRLVGAATNAAPPKPVAVADTATAGRLVEWSGLTPVLGYLVEHFGVEKVLVVPILMPCPICTPPALQGAAEVEEWRSKQHRLSLYRNAG
jgi:transcriptional regulator with XRE-family HTH domain